VGVIPGGLGLAAKKGPKWPVRIDIRPIYGLEIARPGRRGRRRDKAYFAIFGFPRTIVPNAAFQSIRIVP
jgi:hypothetical protein